jgi:hypothetical protein
MRNLLLRLHRDDSAQVSFLAVAAALCFVGLLAMVMNSNDLVRERIRAQEVADVTALSAATWNARGLNMISMINVLNSKLLSTTVLVNSLDKTLPVVKKVAMAQESAFTACSGVPVVGAFCAVMAAVVKVQKMIIQSMEQVIKSIARFTACKKLAWTIMDSLQAAAEGVRLSFPAIATASAVEIARANGATFGVALNGGLVTGSPTSAMQLPVTADGYKTADFCDAMKAGGPGYVMEGYDSAQGSVRLGKKIWDIAFIPFFNLFPHPIFYGFYSFYMAQLGCTPDPESEEQQAAETDFYDLPTCRKYNAKARWQRFRGQTGWVSNGNWTTDDFVAWQPLNPEDQGDGPSDSDMDKFADLGKYGFGNPNVENEPEPPRGPGYRALESERKRNSTRVKCTAGDSSSGYPRFAGSITNPGCGLSVAGCKSLRNHPAFTRYSGTTHQRHPGGLDAERTGVYYMNLDRDSRQMDDGEGNTVTRYRYTINTWVLASSGSAELEGDELDEYIQSQGGDSIKPGDNNDNADSKSCRNRIQPLLIDSSDNPDNRMRFIAMVYTDLGSSDKPLPFWSNFFDTPPERITAYAQAQVYNKLSEDMFTQDWRARLEHANLLESALSSENGFSLSGSGDLATEFIGSANNH